MVLELNPLLRTRFLRFFRDVLKWHLINGSPVYLGGQLQIGLWVTTWHSALIPHVPGQGSMHFWLTQAWFSGHSELDMHSGLQVGGEPIYPIRHVQTAWLLMVLHKLYGPHGEGTQGFVGGSISEAIKPLEYVRLCL